MTYKVEDEVDWSDGTIDEPFSTTGASGDSGYVSPVAHEDDGLNYLFESQEEHQPDVPLGTELPPGMLTSAPQTPKHPTLTRAQRARIGVHLNRRQPSEQDYAHFALYQANQKAYEASFLKHFVNHALHPSQIEQCFQQGTDACSNAKVYVASVLANINGIANKMTWNAHCRAVNLLANAGKDGAPFWDIGSFDRAVFIDFNPSNTVLVAHRMSESWHRVAAEPPMVHYTTKDYPIGHHSSPLEEIDDVADTLFHREAFGSFVPPGRTVKLPTKRSAKGRGLPGASIRDRAESTRRGNWLASLVSPAVVQEDRESSQGVSVDAPGDISTVAGPRILDDLRQYQDYAPARVDTTVAPLLTEVSQPSIGFLSADSTRPEQLFEKFGADALSGHHPADNTAPRQDQVKQVRTWPLKLLDDHKRRLTERRLQVLRRALPGIRTVIAEAIQQGYHPVNADLEELIVDIESREQSKAAPAEVFEEESGVVHIKKAVGASMQEPSHGKKRKREQPAPIRMFNKPVERSKKRAEANATSRSIAALSVSSRSADRPRKQTITTSASPSSTNKLSRPTKRKASGHAPPAPVSQTPLLPHPSGSATLEPHQHLPPCAYFAPRIADEKLVWRCSIKHALGHYYNAGDRKNCPGCFTALSDNTNALTMDFYLPSRTHYHQPNPTSSWRPSKPFGTTFGRARRSKHLSHNSIAKEAYWAAIDQHADTEEARKLAVDAVLQHLAPKPPPREPTPTPTSTPEPDLGPHPSGSTAMEHGQDIPYCAYFQKRERDEDFAWRCDVSHALGRYYLAGDKRSCPGCGSNKGGLAKHANMDFYLPPGVVVRQEMPHCLWKPRKPYKAREGRDPARKKTAESTHNQLASRKYREAIDAGKTPEDALAWAVAETDRWLDEREDEAVRRAEERANRERSERSERVEHRERNGCRERSKRSARRGRASHSDHSFPTSSTALNAVRARARARARNYGTDTDVNDADTDEMDHDETDHEMHNAAPLVDMEDPSSSSPPSSDDDDDTSSGSDSE